MATNTADTEEATRETATEGPAPDTETHRPEARVGWRYTLSRVQEDSTARAGLYIIAFMSAVALFAFVDSQLLNYAIADAYLYSPVRDPANPQILQPPVGITNEFGTGTWAHPLGTDHRGRDILVRLIYGTRIAMTVGIVATGIGVVFGTLIGAVAGYYGDLVDDTLMRAVETVYAIPFLVLVIAFMTAFGRNMTFAMIGVSITTIPVFSRLIRSRVVSVREEAYIEAARASGVRDRNIIMRHIIPNSFAPVLVQATLQIGVNILIVAGLSFLGFGAQPPTPSWGQMLSSSRGFMLPDPWFSIWPGMAILITVIGFNLLGDGLRDAFDPRLNN